MAFSQRRRFVRTPDDIRYELDDEGEAYVRDAAGAGELVRTGTLHESIRDIAFSIAEAFQTGLTPVRPDGITVEFALRLDAEAGFLVAKGTADAHFVVTLNWTRGDSNPKV